VAEADSLDVPSVRSTVGRRLILFSAAFPYGFGEQFLETELPYLAAGFRKVLLVPRSKVGVARAVPANVIVLTALARGRSRRWLDAIGAALRLPFSRDAWLEVVSRWQMLWKIGALRRLVAMYAEGFCVRNLILSEYRRRDLDEHDVVYTYWLSGATLGAVLARRVIPDLRVLTRAHGVDLYEERSSPAYLPFRNVILANTGAVHAVSDDGAAYLRQRWPSACRNVRVSRLGVRDPMCDALPSADEVFRVVSCSFVIAIKRLDLIVDALVLLANRLPGRKMEWTHIGDGPLRARVASRAATEMPANIRARFLGELSNRDVLDFYRQHAVDVFVNVSASEGIPVSIMEAQSFGIPVVATGVGGTPEIVNAGNGTLLPPNPSKDAVCQALEAFISGAAGIYAKRTASKASWRTSYNAEINYTAFVRDLRCQASHTRQ